MSTIDAAQQTRQQAGRVAANLVVSQGQIVDALEQDREPIRGPDGGEEGVEAGLDRVLAQQRLRRFLVGVDPELLVRAVEQRLGAGAKLGAGGPRSGEDENVLGADARGSASASSRKASASVRPEPAAPRTSSGPPSCVATAALSGGRRLGVRRAQRRGLAWAAWQVKSMQGSPPSAGWTRFAVMVGEQRELFESTRGIAARTEYVGEIGEGGDRTLVIDAKAEDIVFAELERLHAEGASFTAISEERGEVVFGDGSAPDRVVIDPIDGSLNARRTIPSFALSIAVASGPSMADVNLGFVHDFGAGEEFTAERGGGARLDGESLLARGPGYGLELVGLEASKPELIGPTDRGPQGQGVPVSLDRGPGDHPLLRRRAAASTACSAAGPVARSTSRRRS